MPNLKRLRLLVRNFQENGLKLMLENPGNVHDVLKMLDVELLPRIDLTQMQVVPGRFVQRDYRHVESDLVLQAPVRSKAGGKSRKILLYILIEHQSEPDRFMVFRVLEYVVMIYKRQLRLWQKEHESLDNFRFQPVLPIVLYTGTRTWSGMSPLREEVELGVELTDRIPEIRPLFLDAGHASRQILEEQGGPFGLLLRLLKEKRAPLKVFEATLSEVVSSIQSLVEEDRQRWLELLSYIDAMLYYERAAAEYQPLHETVSKSVRDNRDWQEVSGMAKSMAEVDMEQCAAEAIVRVRREVLVDLLRHKFHKVPLKILRRIESTDGLEILKAWFELAIDAKTLEELPFAAME
jgi:hypothetical protein